MQGRPSQAVERAKSLVLKQPSFDVVVVGGGPSGLAATAALTEAGLRVASLAPRHPPRWPNTYGVWLEELETAGLSDCAERVWPTARVELGEGRSHRLERPYALVDNIEMRDQFVDRSVSEGVTWIEGSAVSCETTEMGVRLEQRGGDSIEAVLAVDASGHQPSLARRSANVSAGFQTAVGIVVPCDDMPVVADEMMLMDYRVGSFSPEGIHGKPPTFLYAMPLDQQRCLLEETVLVARPKLGFDLLEERLGQRLAELGLGLGDVESTERVVIPMGLPLPEPGDGVLPFGGAASMVHPASGYMVGRTLIDAEPMAQSVARVLDDPHSEERRERAIRAGWEAIWPPERRRARELLVFGMENLIGMDVEQTARFFDAFFSLDTPDWSAYLSGRISAARTAEIMLEVFRKASLGIKGHLARSALSSSGVHLVRSVVGGAS